MITQTALNNLRRGHMSGCARLRTRCDDPQCGDSTWDHYCDLPFPCNCDMVKLLDAYEAALDRERDLAKAVTALLGAFTTAPEGDSPAWKGPACTQARAAIRKHKEAIGE